jgi:hypothetical protein
MSKQSGRRITIRERLQARIRRTQRQRDGTDELETRADGWLPGAVTANHNLGFDDEADGDSMLAEEGEEGDGPAFADVFAPNQDDEFPSPRLALPALIGSRPPVVLLRLERDGDGVKVRRCAASASAEACEALALLEKVVVRCFEKGRAELNAQEWDELLGAADASLTRRMTLLLRLAADAGDKVSLSQDSGAAFTPHDVGLERFAGKFAALPDGTPFSLRLLLMDKRGRERGDHFFDRLPEAVRLLALRKALAWERKKWSAVSDNEFRDEIQKALEELLGVPVPKPTEDHVRRRLRDNFVRRGLAHVFPNQRARQRAYEQEAQQQEAADRDAAEERP